jgi:hypothetical protein
MKVSERLAVVGAYRFARGGAFSWMIGNEQHDLTAKQGDFFLRPLRRQGYGWAVSDPPTVLPLQAYGERIVSILEELLNLSMLPLDESHRYPDPGWSLEKYGASVSLQPGGALDLLHMRGRGRGSFVGEGPHIRLEKDRIPEELPRSLLEAMGERLENVDRFLK